MRLPEQARILIDGKTEDPVWNRAEEVSVALTGPGPASARLKAFHDGKRLYLLVRWEDPTQSRNRYWKYVAGQKWERHAGEDGLAISWGPGGLADSFREQGCTLFCHGQRHDRAEGEGIWDVWYWGAQRSNALTQAIDMALRFGPRQSLRGDGQPAESGNVPNESTEYEGPAACAMQQTPGVERELLLSNSQPLSRRQVLALSNSEGWEVPLDLVRSNLGSRGDVTARGAHDGTGWTVELSRLLATGNPDDEPLGDPLVSSWMTLAVYDAAEGAAHAISRPIEVVFLPTGPGRN